MSESKSGVVTMDKVVSLCKRRGYIFPGSEIYGGLANTWDYGPLGVEFKNNVKQAWWRDFVHAREDVVGMDSAILMNPEAWEASGHVASFADPLMDCKKCKARVRGDKVLEDLLGTEAVAGKTFDEIYAMFAEHQIKCPECKAQDWTPPRAFNLMFKTHQGVIEETAAVVYLRPETAQGIFVNFRNVYTSTRIRVPFGIAQSGKSFRNEITPGNFTFRTREFEQMELEFFCKPGSELEWFAYWKNFCHQWLLGLGLKTEKVRLRDHDPKELSHYSNATTDIEYEFPFGWGELWGIASRTDFDLKQHMKHSGEDLIYIDQQDNERYVPYVIEPSLGADRLALTLLVDAYDEAEVQGEKRVFLRLHPRVAPVKAAILPLSKKDPLIEMSRKLRSDLLGQWNVEMDVTGSIGKRYARQDEIGTPFCITVDFDSLNDQQVTVRERDSMKQDRIALSQVKGYLAERLG